MTEEENPKKIPENELLDKINNSISKQKEIEINSKKDLLEEKNQALMTKYGEIEPIDEAIIEEEVKENEEGEVVSKRSWVKIFFIFLLMILFFNIAYIFSMMETKEDIATEKATQEVFVEVVSSLEKKIEKVEILENKIEKKLPPIIEIEKKIEKPLEDAIEKAVNKLNIEHAKAEKLLKEEAQKKELEQPIPKEKKEEEKKEELKKEIPALAERNPDDYIDVIEMRSVGSSLEVTHSQKPLSKEERERKIAKKALLEQMQH